MIRKLKVGLLAVLIIGLLASFLIVMMTDSTSSYYYDEDPCSVAVQGPYYVTRVNSTARWKDAISPDSRRIYFHETSGRSALDLRQSCAVESTARHNPNRSVQLFMQTDQVNRSAPWLSILDEYDNVAVILINAAEYFAKSPLESWFQKANWRRGPYRQEHFSDYIRMLSSLRFGGLYMDLDFVTLKPLDENVMWNFFPVEDKEVSSLNGGIFHLEHGHWMVKIIIQLLAAKYNPKSWGGYGPDLITKAMTTHCGFQKKKKFQPDLPCMKCDGKQVKLLPYHHFYPIPWQDWRAYFDKETKNRTAYVSMMKDSYAIHVWNKLSFKIPLVMTSNQLYATLATEHCPLTAAQFSLFL